MFNLIFGLFKTQMFQRILDEKPSVLKKIVPVYGDLTKPGLALSDKHLDLVIKNSEIVFHLAATLKLEATLKQAVEMNLVGTKNVVDVCKKMPKLIQMMHLSTAFCCSEHDVLEERIYEWKWDNPKSLISSANLMSDETMQAMEITMLKTQPNTYTLTKRLTEIMMRDEFNNNFPVTIVRPSIVTPAYQEPMPGWVDSLNGPIGLMIGAAKGVIRSMLVDGELAAEVIPVDLAINALIMITKDVSTLKKKPIEIPVYNVTVSEKKKTKMSWVLETGKKINFDFPFEAGLWYPDGGITTNKFKHQLNVIFFHWLPAYFIDFLMLILGQKRFMIHVQNKVSQGLEVLQFFTMRNWNFKADKMKEILKNMTPEEYDMFFIDSESVKDDYEYLKTSILGGRQYCLKEPLSSLPKARIQLRL